MQTWFAIEELNQHLLRNMYVQLLTVPLPADNSRIIAKQSGETPSRLFKIILFQIFDLITIVFNQPAAALHEA